MEIKRVPRLEIKTGKTVAKAPLKGLSLLPIKEKPMYVEEEPSVIEQPNESAQ